MSERPTNRQRIELSLEKRIELIKCAESVPKPSLKILSSKFGIGKSTVGDILQKKEVYKAKYEKNSNPNEKCFDNILANLTNWMNLCGNGFAVHEPRTYQFQVQLSNKKPSYLQKNLTLPTLKVQMAGLTNGRNDTRSKALKWAVKALELILTQLMTTREESLRVIEWGLFTWQYIELWWDGKAQKPRCFKNIKPEQLPVTYIANKKAWMTHDIFFNMD